MPLNRGSVLCLLVMCLLFVAPAPWAAQDKTTVHTINLNGHNFTLPPGFVIELAAGPPLVERPITVDFDELGRLYVSDSSGSNEKVDVQLQKKPHRIVRLEDTDGDGRFDKNTVFADQMMFPEGTMWHARSLYVAAPPSIWKLTDTDGDGVADQRIEWFQGKTLTGCANDLHGPYLGPDGWIYWCKGAFAKQTYERPGRPPWVTRASHVFRARPDGSGLEPVMTGGMDNPVDLAFTSGGERFITTTFFQYPAGGKRDGLIHIVYGGIYGKEHDSIYEHPWTGPSLMPVLTHLGPAAPAGLHCYEARAFGPDYEGNLFAALFNLQKVTRHILQPDGATFKCRDEDFVVSDNKDFHPTDVVEDADGSLLVIDTGGWYKLCCPSSQLYKPDVRGAIYRVRRKDASPVSDPRGLKLAWAKMSADEPARLLDDRRPAVRRRAVQSLGEHGPGAIAALQKAIQPSGAAEARRNAVWAATRIDHPSARRLTRLALLDSDDSVRQAALHAISVWRDGEAMTDLVRVLQSRSLHNRRAAAEALGRLGDRAAVPAVLAAAGRATDRVLEHSLTFALIEIADAEGTALGLKSQHSQTRRAALAALDQMEQGRLGVNAVVAELASADPGVRATAWWVAGRHPEWGTELSSALRDRLAEGKLAASERDDVRQQLVRLARSPAVQAFVAQTASDAAVPTQVRQLALQAMAQSDLKQTPQAWLAALTKILESGDEKLIRDALAAVRAVRWAKDRPQGLVTALVSIGTDGKLPAEARLTALAALPDGLNKAPESLTDFLRMHVLADGPVATRGLAADVLSRARLGKAPLLALAESIPNIGPMEIDRVLQAFARSTDEDLGAKLLAALRQSPARAGLRPESVRTPLAKYSPSIRKQAEEFLASLNEDEAKQKSRLDDMLASLPAGDIRRGQAVFNGVKGACASCHAIGYLGGKVGPDLTRIGGVRTERDLLESIVFPNASFVRGYESVVVATRDGKSHNGILQKDAPDEIALVLGADQQVRIARGEIEEMAPGRVSVMPSGLDQQLSPQELADLVAFLRACR